MYRTRYKPVSSMMSRIYQYINQLSAVHVVFRFKEVGNAKYSYLGDLGLKWSFWEELYIGNTEVHVCRQLKKKNVSLLIVHTHGTQYNLHFIKWKRRVWIDRTCSCNFDDHLTIIIPFL